VIPAEGAWGGREEVVKDPAHGATPRGSDTLGARRTSRLRVAPGRTVRRHLRARSRRHPAPGPCGACPDPDRGTRRRQGSSPWHDRQPEARLRTRAPVASRRPPIPGPRASRGIGSTSPGRFARTAPGGGAGARGASRHGVTAMRPRSRELTGGRRRHRPELDMRRGGRGMRSRPHGLRGAGSQTHNRAAAGEHLDRRRAPGEHRSRTKRLRAREQGLAGRP